MLLPGEIDMSVSALPGMNSVERTVKGCRFV